MPFWLKHSSFLSYEVFISPFGEFTDDWGAVYCRLKRITVTISNQLILVLHIIAIVISYYSG